GGGPRGVGKSPNPCGGSPCIRDTTTRCSLRRNNSRLYFTRGRQYRFTNFREKRGQLALPQHAAKALKSRLLRGGSSPHRERHAGVGLEDDESMKVTRE